MASRRVIAVLSGESGMSILHVARNVCFPSKGD